MVTLQQINDATPEQFAQLFGGIFENSPHIAQKAALARPFVSLEQAFGTMKQIVHTMSEEQKLTLILEHPELGRRIAMSEHSVQEQAGAGLNALTAEEFEQLSTLNDCYMKKFNFPFIIAVAGLTKHDIIEAITGRLSSDYETEFATALNQINQIAAIRFNALLTAQLAV